jgi:hypothetical protein
VPNPILTIVLKYAKAVDPNILQIEPPRNLNGIRDDR